MKRNPSHETINCIKFIIRNVPPFFVLHLQYKFIFIFMPNIFQQKYFNISAKNISTKIFEQFCQKYLTVHTKQYTSLLAFVKK